MTGHLARHAATTMTIEMTDAMTAGMTDTTDVITAGTTEMTDVTTAEMTDTADVMTAGITTGLGVNIDGAAKAAPLHTFYTMPTSNFVPPFFS